jgi:hypothetical protein
MHDTVEFVRMYKYQELFFNVTNVIKNNYFSISYLSHISVCVGLSTVYIRTMYAYPRDGLLITTLCTKSKI